MLPDKPLRKGSRFVTTLGVLRVIWTLGDVVRKLRDERGWTQEKLGELAGLHPTAVNRLERTPDKSERATIDRVAKALDVSAADLYAFAEEASLSAELSEAERRSVMLYQRRLIEKRQQSASAPPAPTPRADPSGQGRESDAPTRIRRRK